ncbi:glycosyltransferase [Plantactinospora siamensis]|uniref:Glycosyltransferase n=1 Tax=Plantactinospora siamensis TaxID=555372 RepID=A0ABV6P168_9ACTN
MRIAMISEHASPLAVLGGQDAGGQNTHVAELATALAEAGHDVRVYTRRDDPTLAPAVPVRPGVTVAHVPAGPAVPVAKDELLPHMAEFSRWLTREWGEGWRPDVVHAHFWMSGLAGITAGRRRGVPVVLTYHALGTVKRRHQGAQDTSPRGRIDYERALGRAVDRVIVQSRDEVRELALLGVPRSQLTVIPSGVNLAAFAPTGAAAPREPDRPRLLTVGRLVERKGFGEVVEAMRLVPDAECLIIGGPPAEGLAADPQARRLTELIHRHGLADRVRLIGAVPRERMPYWYRSADLLVAAPWYEPFGLTPLEAMACGVPVVGTAVGGLTDTVVPGLTGDLVPPRDPAALGRAVAGLLADPVRRYAYATAALDRARTRYSWQRAADQLGEVYAAVGRVREPSRVGA